MKIFEITDKQKKSEITDGILRGLPEWFGIEASIVAYVEEVRNSLFFVVEVDRMIVGFLSINETSDYCGDIYIIGVKRDYHGKGVGTVLVKTAEEHLKEMGKKFMSVKTLGPSHSDKNYAKTRAFYKKMGFYPLEEFTEIWGEANPCLIMVKCID